MTALCSTAADGAAAGRAGAEISRQMSLAWLPGFGGGGGGGGGGAGGRGARR